MAKKITQTSPVKVLHETQLINRDSARVCKIVEFNGKKFKIIYDLRNGISDLSCYVMDNYGAFQFALNKYDIGHNFTCSYVNNEETKKSDIKVALDLCEKVIIKIY